MIISHNFSVVFLLVFANCGAQNIIQNIKNNNVIKQYDLRKFLNLESSCKAWKADLRLQKSNLHVLN